MSFILEHGAILQITQDFDVERMMYPPSFSLTFDELSIRLYLNQTGAGERRDTVAQSTTRSTAAASLENTVNSMIRELKEASSQESPRVNYHQDVLPNHASEDGKALLTQKNESWERLVDTVLNLSISLIRCEKDPEEKRGVETFMDSIAVGLRHTTVRIAEMPVLETTTRHAISISESQLDAAFAAFHPSKRECCEEEDRSIRGSPEVEEEKPVEVKGSPGFPTCTCMARHVGSKLRIPDTDNDSSEAALADLARGLEEAAEAYKRAYGARLAADLLPAHYA